jgi:protein phosphatase PTC7
MRVRESDLLLLATDGLYDNLFEEEILSIVSTFSRNSTAKSSSSGHQLARILAEAAYHRSQKTRVKTPFSIKKAQFITERASL